MKAQEKKRGSLISYKIKYEGLEFQTQFLFYRLYKLLDNMQFAAIYESETSRKTGDGKHLFNEAEIYSAVLINDDETRKAMIEVFQWSQSGSHKSIGKQEFQVLQLMERIPLQFPSGKLMITKCEKIIQHSFLEYIFNGLEMSLLIGIDYTLSNKEPSDPESLHYFDLSKNQYLNAITSVGQILENYDSDKRFSVYGFGGKIPGLLDKPSHCFALSGDTFHPEVNGIQGVIEGKQLIYIY